MFLKSEDFIFVVMYGVPSTSTDSPLVSFFSNNPNSTNRFLGDPSNAPDKSKYFCKLSLISSSEKFSTPVLPCKFVEL